MVRAERSISNRRHNASRLAGHRETGGAPAPAYPRIRSPAVLAQPAQLGIDEFEVELGVVDDQPRAFDEADELFGDHGERTELAEKLRRVPVDGISLFRNVALGIDVLVEDPAARHMVDQLETGDLDNAMSVRRVETRRLRVEHNLPHAAPADQGPLDRPRRLPRRRSFRARSTLTISPRQRKVTRRPSPVGTTKSARRRFT